MTKKYDSAYGIWSVTTEGDCEGRTVKHLGTFEGYLDEIAFALAGHVCYSLNFKLADSLGEKAKPSNSVDISLDIDSGTWDMPSLQREKFFQNLLKGRNVTVQDSSYYASVLLTDGTTPAEIEAKKKKYLAAQALAKLSKEEREALGFKE